MTSSHLDAPVRTDLADAGQAAADPVREAVLDAARRARAASRELALLTADRKNALLLASADALVAAEARILEANARDIAEQAAEGTGEAMLDRLRPNGSRASPADSARSRGWPTRSAQSSAVRSAPTGCSCGRSGSRSAWSA